MTTCDITRYQLSFADEKSNKFYIVYVSNKGHWMFHWGRWGSKGQSKFQVTDPRTAVDVALRQVYNKESKGYGIDREDTFKADSALFQDDHTQMSAFWSDYVRQHPQPTATPTETKRPPASSTRRPTRSVAVEVDKIEALRDEVYDLLSEGDSDTFVDRYFDIQEKWQAIEPELEMINNGMMLLRTVLHNRMKDSIAAEEGANA